MGRCTTLNMTDTELVDNKSIQDSIKALVNDIRSKLVGNFLISKPVLAIGSTKPRVTNAAFNYQIAGVQYAKAAVAAGTIPGDDIIPTGKYGAVAFDIGADGTIDAIEATGNVTGYATAALAVAAIPVVAAGHVRIGWVTATKSDGAFTFGTTDLDTANTTVVYTDAKTGYEQIGSAIA
jgi:hypothetical protein